MNLSNYRIEKVEGSKTIAYKLHGKRGTVIRLLRNVNSPELLFPVSTAGQVFSGVWFTDRNGSPEQVSRIP